MDEREQAREALEQIAATRRTTAHRAASPKGYYAVAGIGVGLVIVGIGLDGWVRWVLYAVGLVTVLLAMRWYTKHTGVVAWATFREPGAWRAFVMMGVSFAGIAVASFGSLWWAAGAAVVTVLTWAVMGPAWDRAWVRSIEEQP